MATKRRNIDVFSANLNIAENNELIENEPTLVNVLSFANDKKYYQKGKDFTLRLLRTNLANCIVGIVETIHSSNIPPKANKSTRELTCVNIDIETEGLAFANIFLYDTVKNVLLYEVNRNGCFPNQFKCLLENNWNLEEENVNVNVTFPIIFKRQEYDRMLEMSRYKKISIELYNPTAIINCFEEEADSIYNNLVRQNIDLGVIGNANSIKFEHTALPVRLNPLGLSKIFVKGIIDVILNKMSGRGQREYIHKLNVEGFVTDPEGRERNRPIDLIGDTFKESFRITDITVHSDLQESERKIGIEDIYNRILSELTAIRGL